MLRVEYQDEICRFGPIGPIYASAWTMMPRADHVKVLAAKFEKFLERPDPIGILVIGLDAGNPVISSDALRADLIAVFKSAAQREGPTAAVVEATGFVAAFVRSLFAGIFLVTRGRRKNRVFSRRDEALAWLQNELGPAAPADLGVSVTSLTHDLG